MQSSRASEGGGPRPPQHDPARPEAAPATATGADSHEEQRAADGAATERAAAGSDAEHAAEIARLEDRYKRALADLDNYRKRSAREIDRRVGERTESLLRDWLEAVDSVERALRMAPGDPLFSGLRSVLEQMESILARQGVTRIGEAGEPFDPERHEAVDVRMTDEVPDRTVVEVLRSGFALGDRVLRPAQVVVSRRPVPQPG